MIRGTCCAVVFVLLYRVVNAQLDLPPYEDYPDRQPQQQQQQNRAEVERNENLAFRADIKRLLQALDVQASQQCTNNVAAQWNFETHVNEHTQLEAVSGFLNFCWRA